MARRAPRDAHARPDGGRAADRGRTRFDPRAQRSRLRRDEAAQAAPSAAPKEQQQRWPTNREDRRRKRCAPSSPRPRRGKVGKRAPRPTKGAARQRRARRRARGQRNQPPPGPTPEEMKRNEIKAEADAILESGVLHLPLVSEPKSPDDEEFDEKTGKMRKLTVKERKRRRKLRSAAMRRAAAKASGRLAWMVAAYTEIPRLKGRTARERVENIGIQTVTVDRKARKS